MGIIPSNLVALGHALDAHIQEVFIYVCTHIQTDAYLLHMQFVKIGINLWAR